MLSFSVLRVEPAGGGRCEVGPDVLGLAVLLEAGEAELASGAGLLEAAPLGLRYVGVVVVDPHRAEPESAGDALTAAGVAGPHRSGQAVDGVVGQSHRLVLGAERLHRQNRTE